MRLFTGHDHQPGGRDSAWEVIFREQRRTNVHLVKVSTREAFVKLREARDRELAIRTSSSIRSR